MKVLKQENQVSKASETEINQFKSKISELQSEIEVLRQIADKAEFERKEIKKYAHELIDKVKQDAEAQKFLIDRRMINQFLINFVNPKSSQQVKLQMVDAMSKILEFSNDERTALGLKPADKSFFNIPNTSASNSQQVVNIADKLVNFLLDDE